MDKELTRRERKRIQKWFEEKRLWREKKRRRTKPKANRKKRTRRSHDWVGLLDEEAQHG